MKIRAANNKLIISIRNEETKTESGLIISAQAKGITYDIADVVSAGPLCAYAKQGDVIIIKSGTHFPLVYEDTNFRVTEEETILAFLEE